MKTCPQCEREYEDETLNFCLDDGVPLSLAADIGAATVVLRSKGPYDFDNFRLDVAEKVLLRNGAPVQLTPKCFAALQVLVENAGHLLEKDELLRAVWPDQFVEEGNLAYTVKLLRKALGEDAEAPKYIQTVPRRVYRFIADVRPGIAPSPESDRVDFQVPSDNLLTDSLQGIYGPMIGRAKEIEEINALLTGDDIHLVTLTGIGGTGKTRLARETGRQLKDRFPDGVFWVDLSSVVDPMMVAPTIAQVLAVKETTRGILAALEEFFRERSMLLILDNFEQVVSAGVHLAQFLQSAGDLKMLVTSREPLKLRAETEYQVPPLTVPPPGINETVTGLMRFDAIQLFVQRATRARPDFGLTEINAAAVSAICQKLDGLPLALELAASRAKVLSVSEILEKLENSLALLTGGSRDMPSRQQTMRAMFEWSYGLLNDQDKQVFDSLAVFEGGFSFRAAERILVASNDGRQSLSETDIADSIGSLTEKGLLLSNKSANGEMRFRMLVVVREYAIEMLYRGGNATSICRAHGEYFRDLAEEAAPHLLSSRSAEWLDRLETEHDNFSAAIKWAIEAEPQTAAQIASSLRNMWTIHGHIREGRHWPEEILKKGADISWEVRWELLTGLGNSAQFRGDIDYARDAYLQSLEVCRSAADQEKEAKALRGIAAVEYMQFNFGAARSYINEALVISRAVKDDLGTGAAFARLGDICLAEGDSSEARLQTGEALRIFKEIAYKQGIAAKSINLGFAEIADLDPKSGRLHLEEGFRLSLENNDQMNLQLGIYGFCALMIGIQDHLKAAKLFGAAQHIGEQIEKNVLEPAEHRFREGLIGKLQAAMSERELNEAIAEGRRMSIREAVDLALEEARGHEKGRKGLRPVGRP